MTPTHRQLSALRFIAGFQEAHGYSPSVKEIARGLGGNSHGSAHTALLGLEERGLIRRLPNRARAIEVLADISIPRSPEGEPMFWLPVEGLPKGRE